MNLSAVPWLELTVAVPLLGAAAAACGRDGDTRRRVGSAAAAATLCCAVLAWLGHETGASPDGAAAWELLPRLLGDRLLALDALGAPLLPLVALLAFLVVHAATGPDDSRWTVPLLLAAEATQLAAFAAPDPRAVAAFLALGTIPPYLDLRLRGARARGFLVHAVLFVGLLAAGVALLGAGADPALACVPLLLAALARTATVPLHLWAADLFEKGSFAAGLLYVTPLAGVFVAARLVLPVCPAWVLQVLGFVSLFTAVYAAGLSVVQTDARRFAAYQVVSHGSMVMVGLQLNTPISLTGALCLWFAVALTLAGQGLALRAVEARVGRLALTGYRGLYDQAPALAVLFLISGLGSVGFPGTLGFVAAEMLAGGAVGADPAVGVVMIVAAALNGIAVVRVYFLVFTGGRHAAGVPLAATGRERLAALVTAGLILGGGLYPQPGVDSRHRAAAEILAARDRAAGPAR